MDRLTRIATDIEGAGGKGVAYSADVRDESAVSKLFDDVEAQARPHGSYLQPDLAA